MTVDRAGLLASIEQQRRQLERSIVLTPVDSFAFCLPDRDFTAPLHGLYLTDKVRTDAEKIGTLVQFAGRDQAARDLNGIHHLLADRLGAAVGSMRLLSGLHAHATTFMSIAEIGQSVAILPELGGGHFSTRSILERLGLRVIDLPIDVDQREVNREATEELIDATAPDFIFVDRSEGLRYEDFSFVGQLHGPTSVFDASQFLTQIVTGRYESPMSWEFDLSLMSLHKSFPGPQKAAIVSREDSDVWRRLVRGLSTFVSSSHAENTYLAGLALLRTELLETYCARMLDTALRIEHELNELGVPVVLRGQDHPDRPTTQHVWIAAEDQAQAFDWYRALENINVQTNYRKLPYDLGYGLRLGTSFSAVAGLTADLAAELATIIAEVVGGNRNTQLASTVEDLAMSCRPHAIVTLSGVGG